MSREKLNKWADLLLDTGKRNNLINFKDTKMGTASVVAPDFEVLFSKAEHSASFEVYDPKLDEEDDETDQKIDQKSLSKEEYIRLYAPKLKKNGQILIYNAFESPIKALRNIEKRAKTAIEETGVNIAYMAFGFINWSEDESVYHAPVLLAPISIENESAVDPYYIKITDSEIIVNPTFAFKIKNEYGIELPPFDEESATEYLQKVEEIISKLKWSVSYECKIGLFSFLKINMHKDLKENAPVILKNKGVRALLGEENIEQEAKRDEVGSLYSVVDADSSQNEAIELARLGKSFVLQGPPGTGKSQTITNIIADRLADGKKVLFVSEKLAALSVVYDKLKTAGLEEFCLELHSHKANKKDVIAELCHTLKLPKSVVSIRAQKELDEKIRAQKELDGYASELHKTRPIINESLYGLYQQISAVREAPEVEFVVKNIKEKGEEYIQEAISALLRYTEYTHTIGSNYHKNPFYGYVNLDCSYPTVTALKSDLGDTVQLLDYIIDLNDKISKTYSIKATNIAQAYCLLDLFYLIKDSKFITPELLKTSSLPTVIKTVNEMKKYAEETLKNKAILDEVFDEDIYKQNGQTLYKTLSVTYSGLIKRVFSKEYGRIKNELRLCSKDGRKIKYEFALSTAKALKEYQQNKREFETLEKKIKSLTSSAYQGVNTDFGGVIFELEELLHIQKGNLDCGKLATISKNEFVSKQADFGKLYQNLQEQFDSFGDSESRVASNFDATEYDVRSAQIEELREKYARCIENIDKIDEWCEFVKLLGVLSKLEIRQFVDYCIKNKIKTQSITNTYAKAFYKQWVDVLLRENPTLVTLSRIPHDEAVKTFKEKDRLTFEINKARIKEKLSKERPSLDMVAQGSAVAILLREGEKKRKQKSIRNLLEEIGELVQTLKPCFLMSPLSVSTFLSAEVNFDTVIFDEASQIFPQDAIGAIYRGKQLIVVGDSKQMPPSNFFSTTIELDDEDEEDDVTDFESILDLCSTTLMQKRLKWHYRSRYEELISFSNKNFYDGDLVTFPSAKTKEKGVGVDYYFVDGTFDRTSKTNRIEAEKVVDLVFENIEKYPERSLGVVAFSISQQNLIDKLITKRRKKDASKEEFFKADRVEPFFVKNLETVQGDERDTIIFSVAYGKDAQGKLLLNFGPVNKAGGERRLNVAVTRAKSNVQLVSSMRYTDIDLNRTQSTGARLLREYLDYAQNGEIALKREKNDNVFALDDNDFEKEVAEFLRAQGYIVDERIGCSSFKVDLALKKPNSSDYLIAIECDGKGYKAYKNTRDRDRLRAEVLGKMGWAYYRVWSTDWFRNKRVEKEKLLDAVKRAIVQADEKKKEKQGKIRNAICFEEIANPKKFEFPKYKLVDEKELATKKSSKWSIIKTIIETEAPISEEWLLKRVAFVFGREKVTSVVKEEYLALTKNYAGSSIVRKNGFLYIKDKPIPMLRVPEENARVIREGKYIELEELANGMRAILKENVTVEKGGLFRLIVQKLGFARMGDALNTRLEDALKLLRSEIEISGENLSLK